MANWLLFSGGLNAAFYSRLARICLERFLLPTQLLSSFSKHLLSGRRAFLICLSRRQDLELTGLHFRTFFFLCFIVFSCLRRYADALYRVKATNVITRLCCYEHGKTTGTIGSGSIITASRIQGT
jgi:hypothetical protein